MVDDVLTYGGAIDVGCTDFNRGEFTARESRSQCVTLAAFANCGQGTCSLPAQSGTSQFLLLPRELVLSVLLSRKTLSSEALVRET